MEHESAGAGAEASRLVAALESAWKSIQATNPGVPDAVIVLGTGVERGRLSKLGHWWGGQWVADGTVRGEVLLAGEALHLKPTDVFEVLLHEAAHGLNTSRGVKDVSRGGRYHNAKFKATAIEVGLRVGSMPPYGWAKTDLAPKTVEHYSVDISRISEEMRIARRLSRASTIEGTLGGEGSTTGVDSDLDSPDGTSKKNRPAECGCGRKMRMSPSVLAKGPVICGVCQTGFEVDRVATVESEMQPDTGNRPEPDHGEVVNTFLKRRSLQLDHEDGDLPRPDRPGRELSAPAESPLAITENDIVTQLRRQLRTRSDAERLVTVAQWLGPKSTEPEMPMPARNWAEQRDLTQIARTVLELDGALTRSGPTARPTALLIGERVKTADSIEPHLFGLLPEPDTPGRVLDIDVRDGTVTIDFAAWGRTEIPIEDVQSVLRLDYATVHATDTAVPQAPPSAPTLGIEL